MSHTASGTTTNYSWDVNRSLPEILQDGTNTYVYGLELISSTDSSGNQAYYTHDGLGSTRDLTSSSGAKIDGYTYDAFGAPTHTPGSSANPFQFTGQQTDADSGLQYLRARYYDPGTGRFVTRDPFDGTAHQPQSQNRYAYVQNNPATMIDPTGMVLQDAGGGGDKEGGSGSGGNGGPIGGVNRGNLRPCPGGKRGEGQDQGINEAVKEAEGAEARDIVLCDDEGNVYIHYYGTRIITKVGHISEYQQNSLGGFSLPGDIGQYYNQPYGAYAVVAVGGVAYIVWFYDNIQPGEVP
jgi:RHS repeat-associated protein